MVAAHIIRTGVELRAVRESSGISRARLAGALGCSPQRVWQVEAEAFIEDATAERFLTAMRQLKPDILIMDALHPAVRRAVDAVLYGDVKEDEA